MTLCPQVLGLRFVLMVWFSTAEQGIRNVIHCSECFSHGGCAKTPREHLWMEFSFSSLLQGGPKRQPEMDGQRSSCHSWQQLWRGISGSGTAFKTARCSSMSLETRTWLKGTCHMPGLPAWEGDLNSLNSHLTPEHPEQTWGS